MRATKLRTLDRKDIGSSPPFSGPQIYGRSGEADDSAPLLGKFGRIGRHVNSPNVARGARTHGPQERAAGPISRPGGFRFQLVTARLDRSADGAEDLADLAAQEDE